jgi:hypothetical protein
MTMKRMRDGGEDLPSARDYKKLLHTPSKYAARIAQAFIETDPSAPRTDGIGTTLGSVAEIPQPE